MFLLHSIAKKEERKKNTIIWLSQKMTPHKNNKIKQKKEKHINNYSYLDTNKWFKITNKTKNHRQSKPQISFINISKDTKYTNIL